MNSLRLVQLGIDHPHGEMYRTTIAHHHGIDLVAGFDPNPERARALLTGEQRDMPLLDDIDRAIATTAPDAVLVTLPNDVTPGAIVTAANRGLGIFAEKPCAVSADTFRPAIDAIDANQVPFVPAYLRRVSPVAAAMRELVADGIIGDLVSAQITFATTNAALRNATYLAGGSIERATASAERTAPPPPSPERHWLFDRARSGGGVMHWLGVHWLDLLRLVSGDEVTHLTATLASRSTAPIDVEDVASVTLESTGGMIATVTCAYVLPHGPDQVGISIQGTHGWMQWDGGGPELRVRSDHPSWRVAPVRTLHFESEPVPGYSGALGWEAMERFRAAVQEGEAPPVNAIDALRVLEMLDAIQRSGREGRRVAVESQG